MAIGNTQDLERRLYVANGELGKDASGNPFNYVDGSLAGIYFYDDPGNFEKKVKPCKKLCIELVDTDEQGNEHRYVVIGRYDGSDGAASWFATTVADGLEKVQPGEWCRISVKAATGNTKVTFANVDLKVGNSWQRQRSETNYSLIEPSLRGQLTYDLITKHAGFHAGGKPAESVQEPQVAAEADERLDEANWPPPDPEGDYSNEPEGDKDPRGAPRGAKGGFFAIAKSIGIPMGGEPHARQTRHMHYAAVLGRIVNSGNELTDMDWQILFEDAKKRQAEGEQEDPNHDPFASMNQPAQSASPQPVEDDTLTMGVYETMIGEAANFGIKMHIRQHREKWAILAKLEDEQGWLESGHWREIKNKAETTKKLAAVIAEMKSNAAAAATEVKV